MAAGRSPDNASESDSLLHGKRKKPFYRARPLWIVPFAIIASIVRGMTLAPRVQVFTQLSCNAIYGHDIYDHTDNRLNTSILSSNYPHIPYHIDPAGPHFNALEFNQLFSDIALFKSQNPGNLLADDDDEPDPRTAPSRRCLQDADVQAGAARLQTIMTTTMGLLSAITTGWWGRFGEKHGRTRVLAAATFGLFLTDLMFILVSTPHSIFATHGHKLLVLSPIIEGLLGGWATLQGATSAYVSDCTSDGSRAKIFSRFTGVFFFGFAIGPTVGAYFIRHPLVSMPSHSMHSSSPTVTSVFYIASMCSFINFLLAVFVFPESLEKKKAKAGQQARAESLEHEGSSLRSAKKGIVDSIISPLALFLPQKIESPDGVPRKDWTLTILAAALFGCLLSSGIYQIKYLYAEHVYGWGAEQLSYYISFMGAARAVHLLLIMPFLISAFKPKPKPSPDGAAKKAKPTASELAKEMRFDLMLVLGSLIIDLLSHAFVALSPTGAPAPLFVGFTVLSSFGAGLFPAVNSLGLCVMQTRGDNDTGKLFGAFAVLQSTGQMILGPLLFGLIYSKTVAKFPKAIFTVAAGLLFVCIALVCMVRPNAEVRARRKAARARLDIEIERGRSRISKDISRPTLYVDTGVGSPSAR